ncbi:uncharacterized protein M421DRAFT_88181 [Didymella exigua CBS 183.55]|uniref:Uncharacterized protein n=1 Tax=Didymella exigua CBS 183.55 TaxID=1150837 RepID=A0A6A5S9L7_9PLEO|nr:uncharacterized protein M421DRAFT_88181 [Didymella exigua CBS 183.55]KAF1934167.1 hypothetical protein M421DRAFT_88181 [Didymella exigua CBS 183.55]
MAEVVGLVASAVTCEYLCALQLPFLTKLQWLQPPMELSNSPKRSSKSPQRSHMREKEMAEMAEMAEITQRLSQFFTSLQVNHTLPNAPAVDPATTQRKITETVVQTNQRSVESARNEVAEDDKPFDPLHGKRAEPDLREQYTFDTATWLYHFVFGPSMSELHSESSHQPSVSDEDSEKRNGTVVLPSPDQMMLTSREIIVWGSGTEPSIVVNRLSSA